MGKKVLAIYYSQSGQLAAIVDRLTAPLAEAGACVEHVRIEPAPDYPFPWTTDRFYSVMPDCVLGVTGKLMPFTLKETRYDLVILGYQAWFLYPSIPVNTLLHDPVVRGLLNDTPVVTITGARNMWLNTFLELKKLLHSAGARLVGNIALIDRHPNHISFVTVLHWLQGGKKDRYLNIFPYPGVSAADIEHTSVFGNVIVPHLMKDDWSGLQDELVRRKAVNTRYSLLRLESIAIPTYEKWARFIVKRKKRNAWLTVFRYY
ncbi:MAG TPA: hypothetical protein VMH27_18330, partial [Puia sp.]|nr:hypothetical protein [Puia sp.]